MPTKMCAKTRRLGSRPRTLQLAPSHADDGAGASAGGEDDEGEGEDADADAEAAVAVAVAVATIALSARTASGSAERGWILGSASGVAKLSSADAPQSAAVKNMTASALRSWRAAAPPGVKLPRVAV